VPAAEKPKAAAPTPAAATSAPRRSTATRSPARRAKGAYAVGASGHSRNVDAARTLQMLENPTRIVTEDQLRGEYGYVVNELRGMFLLAGGMLVVLVVL